MPGSGANGLWRRFTRKALPGHGTVPLRGSSSDVRIEPDSGARTGFGTSARRRFLDAF